MPIMTTIKQAVNDWKSSLLGRLNYGACRCSKAHAMEIQTLNFSEKARDLIAVSLGGWSAVCTQCVVLQYTVL